MTQYTPGPWIFDGRDTITIPDGDLLLLTGVRTPMVIGPAREEARANARLVAAAPDMYEACDEALNCLLGHCISTTNADRQVVLRVQSLLRKALAKIDGKS